MDERVRAPWDDIPLTEARDAYEWNLTFDFRYAVVPRMPKYRGRHKMRTRRQWVKRVLANIVEVRP